MGTYKTETNNIKVGQKTTKIITKESFDGFSEKILDLGEIDVKSNLINGLSVMFDLEGFTSFCKQIDPQLAVPEYLSEFLKWIFDEVKSQLKESEHDNGYKTYAQLPFLSKFLGDGVLFLWETENMTEKEIVNIVISMSNICDNYIDLFYPEISKKLVDAPKKLRCGIARGAIYTVGNGNDFVGPCINMSARLQKLYSLSFCFSRRGINPNLIHENDKGDFVTKKVNIRGIGENELVVMLKEEYENLPTDEKVLFS